MVQFTDLLTITLTLFAVIDILGNIPLLISIKQKTGHINSIRVTWISTIIMLIFLFVGEEILNLIGIDLKSFSIAGALVIFLIAIEMILNVELFKPAKQAKKVSDVVPIAFPLIAGAGTLTTLLSLKSIEAYNFLEIFLGIIINVLFIYLVLRLLVPIEKLLGPVGIEILRRIFGILLLAIAIKLSGI